MIHVKTDYVQWQWTGSGVAIGAGLGLVAGLLMSGGAGIALGMGIGAGVGTALGAAADVKTSRRDLPNLRGAPSREPGRRQPVRWLGDHETLVPGRGDWRIGVGVTSLLAGTYGAIAGWLIPRGPLTTFAALASIVASLVVGGTAGLVMRSRWAMLLAPAVFVVLFELTRMGSVGPTVDAIHLGSTYGILAFAVGRGFHGVLAIFPMVVATAFGAGAGRRLGRPGGSARRGSTAGLYARRGVAIAAAGGIVLLGLAVVRPAGTNPIRDANGRRAAGGIAELTRVKIGGHQLSMMIREQARGAQSCCSSQAARGQRIGGDAQAPHGFGKGLPGGHVGSTGHGKVLRPTRTNQNADL